MTDRIKAIMSRIKPAEVFIGAAGLLALTGLYLYWRNANPAMSLPGVWAGRASAALFAVFGLRLARAWMREWRSRPHENEAIYEQPRVKELAAVFLVCLVAEAAALFLVYIFRAAAGYNEPFFDSIKVWTQLDSQHYIDIAQDWYTSDADRGRVVQLVFLPGYPLLIRLFHVFIGDWLVSAFCASILPFCLGGTMLYKLAQLDMDRAGALRALKYALILPGAFFFAAPMSEGLFFLLSVSCMYCLRKKHWLVAGVFGGLASFTRSLGLVLIVPAAYSFVTDIVTGADARVSPRRHVIRAASIVLMLAGFAAYCLINYEVSGDPLKFLVYQREHWNQRLGLFFNTAAYQTEYALSAAGSDVESLLGLWLPNLVCSFGALVIMVFATRRLKPVYSFYFMAYYVIAVGATWLLSAPRYLVSCAALGLGLSHLTKDRRADDALTILFVVAYVFYAMCMANRWQVW